MQNKICGKMENIKVKAVILFFLTLILFSCQSNKKNNDSQTIMGEWIIVKQNYKGYQKFSLDEAHKIEESILNINKSEIFYENIDFISPCNFDKLLIELIDTTKLYGATIEYLYTKKELTKIQSIIPVNINNQPTCFNNCATFYLKQDTLINICGGYTFFLKKINNYE